MIGLHNLWFDLFWLAILLATGASAAVYYNKALKHDRAVVVRAMEQFSEVELDSVEWLPVRGLVGVDLTGQRKLSKMLLSKEERIAARRFLCWGLPLLNNIPIGAERAAMRIRVCHFAFHFIMAMVLSAQIPFALPIATAILVFAFCMTPQWPDPREEGE